jgi:elongation factor 1 alpha-like protein
MIAGAAQADAAVLVVDASSGAFESGFQPGGQTKEHTLLARSLGVTQLVVAINKMDAVQWSQLRFDQIQQQLLPYLTKEVGFHRDRVSFIPCSGLSGGNLTVKLQDAPTKWYTGLTLCQQLGTCLLHTFNHIKRRPSYLIKCRSIRCTDPINQRAIVLLRY